MRRGEGTKVSDSLMEEVDGDNSASVITWGRWIVFPVSTTNCYLAIVSTTNISKSDLI